MNSRHLPIDGRQDAFCLDRLLSYAGRPDVIVLGLPRGGVPVAFEVARALDAPLDVFLVRKLGAPGHEELAMGAIASGEVVVINDEVVRALKIGPDEVMAEVESEREELARRETAYRDGRPPVDVRRKNRDPDRRWAGHGIDDAGGGDGVTTKQPARIVVAVRSVPPRRGRVSGDRRRMRLCHRP